MIKIMSLASNLWIWWPFKVQPPFCQVGGYIFPKGRQILTEARRTLYFLK